MLPPLVLGRPPLIQKMPALDIAQSLSRANVHDASGSSRGCSNIASAPSGSVRTAVLLPRKRPRSHSTRTLKVDPPDVLMKKIGPIGARAGGAKVLRATARVAFWGALAMAPAAGDWCLIW